MEKKIMLFINATLNQEKPSRTHQLCVSFMNALRKMNKCVEIKEIVLTNEKLLPISFQDINQREELVKQENYGHPMLRYATDFAKADYIIIGAPYWDLSFPAVLKTYLEHVCVCGISFCYTEDGIQGLCAAKNMVYITSSGGYINMFDFGTDYLKGMCRGLFGIKEFYTVSAQGLDIDGADISDIMRASCREAENLANII